VAVRVFPNFSNRLAYRYQAFLPLGLDAFMSDHAGRFDVAHIHACRNFPGVIAARHLRRHKIPYVLAPNGTAPLIERRRLLKRGFDVLFGRRVMRDASRVLAVSDAERRQFGELGVRPSAIAVIPNPVDLDEFHAAADGDRFRAAFQLPAGPLVLFLGKITPRKGLDVLVRAFAALASRTPASLVIAGNDMGGGAEARQLAASLGIGERMQMTGLLAGRDRLDALTAAAVVVYPSQHEIFGLVPLEALLCGTPVIVAGDSGCGEIVRATGGGQVVAYGDASALASAIDTALADLPAWRDAASRAGAVVRDKYGDDTVCAQVEAMYEEMVA
jgi:glycosyltransferase involved in cell wall biosynthesis